MKLLGNPVLLEAGVFTGDREATRLHVEPRHFVSVRRLEQWNELHPDKPAIALVPSGWGAGAPTKADSTQHNALAAKGQVFRIPYSLHSNYGELVAAIKGFKPRRVTGTSDATDAAQAALQEVVHKELPTASRAGHQHSRIVVPPKLRAVLQSRKPKAKPLVATSKAAPVISRRRRRARLKRSGTCLQVVVWCAG